MIEAGSSIAQSTASYRAVPTPAIALRGLL
jgi:hypothetical protein